MEQKRGLSRIFMGPVAIIAVWFGCVVGPGFAAGVQEVQFLVGNSWYGVFLGPVVCMILCAWVTYWVSEYARAKQTYNYRVFYDSFYGKYKLLFSNVKDVFMIMTVILVSGIVYSVGGPLLAGVTNIPAVICGLFSVIVVSVLVMFGVEMIKKSATVITILLIVILTYILAVALPSTFQGAMDYVGARTMNTTPFNAWYKIIVYFPSMGFMWIDAGITTFKGNMSSKKDSLIFAIGGALLIGVATILMNILFAAGMPQVTQESVPTLWVLQNVVGSSSVTQWLYVAFAWLALVSTAVGGIGAVVVRYEPLATRKLNISSPTITRLILTVVAAILAVALGQIGAVALINQGYTILNSIALPAFALPMMILIPIRLRQSDKALAGKDESLKP